MEERAGWDTVLRFQGLRRVPFSVTVSEKLKRSVGLCGVSVQTHRSSSVAFPWGGHSARRCRDSPVPSPDSPQVPSQIRAGLGESPRTSRESPAASLHSAEPVFPGNSRGDWVSAWSPLADRQLRGAQPGGGGEPAERHAVSTAPRPARGA